MRYLFLKRGEDSSFPIDVIEVGDCDSLGYYKILRVIENNDPKMTYQKSEDTGTYHWMCGDGLSFDTYFFGIKKNKYDRLLEFDDDESAKLYLEVIKSEL